MSLSMAEGELIAVCEAAQIMLFSMHVLEDIGLHVKKPMIHYSWNISGLTKDVSVIACFLCELKETNLIFCMWLPTDANMVDIYTKNVSPHLQQKNIHDISLGILY